MFKKGKGGALVIVIVLIIVVIGVFFFINVGGEDTTSETTPSATTRSSEPAVVPVEEEIEEETTPEPVKQEKIIEMSSSGFSPRDLTIRTGDRVTFTNVGERDHWPASDVHPTHTVYPGSNIAKCGGSEEPDIFDSCRGIGPGESYSFVFNEAGEWDYHDHLRPGLRGTITVS